MAVLPSVVRRRPDPHAPGRRSRLERTILLVHAVVLVFLCLCVLGQLARGGDVGTGEVAVRFGVTALLLAVAVDLRRRGERLEHLLVLGAALGLATQLDRWPVPGDVSVALALSAVAISSARLLTMTPFLLVLLVSGAAYAVARTAVGDGGVPAGELLDTVLLTGALTVSVAFFVASLEERATTAESLDAEALEREAELVRQQSQELAATAAGRVLHDDVLTALRLIGEARDGIEPQQVRRSCRASVAAVRELTAP